MIPHTKTKQTQRDHATPIHAIFQRLSVACKTKFRSFSKSYCDSPLLFGLVLFPYALCSNYTKSLAIPRTHHVFHPGNHSVYLCLEYHLDLSSSISSSVQQADNSAYLRGLSWGLNMKDLPIASGIQQHSPDISYHCHCRSLPNLNKTSPLPKVFPDLPRSVRHSCSLIVRA